MCTVTFVPVKNGFIFTSNRDEKINRPTISPKIYEDFNFKLMYPKDEKAGGTWIVSKNDGTCIVLLNGAGSEPTHMYDPKHSIFFAWKEIIKHYDILYKISTYNHQKGHSYLNIKQSRQLVVDNKKLTNHLRSIT
jgi:hypothetical protein